MLQESGAWPSTVNSVLAVVNLVVMVTGAAFLLRLVWGIHTGDLGNALTQPYLRLRWRFIFPVLGLLAFSTVSYHSLRMNWQFGPTPRRFYWWSSIDLTRTR